MSFALEGKACGLRLMYPKNYSYDLVDYQAKLLAQICAEEPTVWNII